MDAYDVLGGPVLRTQLVANPAAGADWSFTPDSRAALEIKAVCAVFTSSAAVANRVPSLKITDGVETVAVIPPPNAQAASLAETYTWIAGGASSTPGAGFPQVCALPLKIILPPGFVISGQTTNIQAADQWSAISIWSRELPNYGEGAEVETHLWRAAQRLADIADALNNTATY